MRDGCCLFLQNIWKTLMGCFWFLIFFVCFLCSIWEFDGLLWISRILFVFCVELGFMLDGYGFFWFFNQNYINKICGLLWFLIVCLFSMFNWDFFVMGRVFI